jgi:hypothetical protein
VNEGDDHHEFNYEHSRRQPDQGTAVVLRREEIEIERCRGRPSRERERQVEKAGIQQRLDQSGEKPTMQCSF